MYAVKRWWVPLVISQLGGGGAPSGVDLALRSRGGVLADRSVDVSLRRDVRVYRAGRHPPDSSGQRRLHPRLIRARIALVRASDQSFPNSERAYYLGG